MPRLFAPQDAEVVFRRYTSSQNVVIPEGVTKLDRVAGAGGPGRDGTSGYYEPNTTHSSWVAAVAGYNYTHPNTFPGTLTWETAQNAHQEAIRIMGKGGSGSITRRTYEQYSNGWVVGNSTLNYSNVVPGSVYAYFAGAWEYSGNVGPGDNGYSYVGWEQYGRYVPGSSPTTGPSSVLQGGGISLVFPGGYGSGQVASSVHNNVAVTPGNLSLTIASGGYIEITYTK